ncbi:MAG: hypothetical protein PHF92_00920, partial [Bacteroidales bacterium]|nr:hypothetical protein [Bacteroidales bacterium]
KYSINDSCYSPPYHFPIRIRINHRIIQTIPIPIVIQPIIGGLYKGVGAEELGGEGVVDSSIEASPRSSLSSADSRQAWLLLSLIESIHVDYLEGV